MPGFDGYDLWHNENGSITFQCTPNKAGTFKISVEFEGVPLNGLPVCCVVQKAGEGFVTAYKAGPEADLDMELNSSNVDNIFTKADDTPTAAPFPTDLPNSENNLEETDKPDAFTESEVKDDDDEIDDSQDNDLTDLEAEPTMTPLPEHEVSQEDDGSAEAVADAEAGFGTEPSEDQDSEQMVLVTDGHDQYLVPKDTLHIQPLPEDGSVQTTQMMTPEGAVITQEGTILNQEGAVINQHGTVMGEDGTEYVATEAGFVPVESQEAAIFSQEGAVLHQEGTVLHQEGAVLQQEGVVFQHEGAEPQAVVINPEHMELQQEYKQETEEDQVDGQPSEAQYHEIHYIQDGVHHTTELGPPQDGLAGAVAMEITDQLPQEISDIKPIVDLGMVVPEGSKYILEKAPHDPNTPDAPIYVIKEQAEGEEAILQQEAHLLEPQLAPTPPPPPPPTRPKRRRGRPSNPRISDIPIIISPNEVSLPKSFTEAITKEKETDEVTFIGPNMKPWQKKTKQVRVSEATNQEEGAVQLVANQEEQQLSANQEIVTQEHILEQRVIGEEEMQLIVAAEGQSLEGATLDEGDALTLMEFVNREGGIVTEAGENITVLAIKHETGDKESQGEEDATDLGALVVDSQVPMETDIIDDENLASVEKAILDAQHAKEDILEAQSAEEDAQPAKDDILEEHPAKEDFVGAQPAEEDILDAQPAKEDNKTSSDVEMMDHQGSSESEDPVKEIDMMSPTRRSRRVAHRKSTVFRCRKTDCDETFDAEEDLDEHSLKVHKEKQSYKCPDSKCSRVFINRKNFRMHLKRAHQINPDDEDFEKVEEDRALKEIKAETKEKDENDEKKGKKDKKKVRKAKKKVENDEKDVNDEEEKDNEKEVENDDAASEEKNDAVVNGDENDDKVGKLRRCRIRKCEKVFDSAEELKEHIQSSHSDKEKRFMCEQCGRVCTTKTSLNKHLATHNRQTEFACDCGKVFRNEHLLEVHKEKHNEGSWCTICNKKYRDEVALEKHHRRVHEKPPAGADEKKCPICEREFGTKSAMQKHIQNIHEDNSVSCDICNKTYKTKENLDRHKKNHTDRKPFMCDLCGAFFKSKDILRCHREGMHRVQQVWETPFGSDTPVLVERPMRPFECKYCNRTFKRKAVMKEHILAAHESTDEIACTYPGCPKTYPTKTLMKTHYRSVHRPKNMRFSCSHPGCPRQFSTSSSLTVHENTHKNVRYQCLQQGCQMSFTTKHHMLMHYRLKHTTLEEKFACSLCGKRFKLKEQVKAHLDCHKTERKYKCDVCGKGFTTQSRLTSHRKIHNIEGDLECVYCGKTFARKFRLQQHLAKHNAQEITVAYSIV